MRNLSEGSGYTNTGLIDFIMGEVIHSNIRFDYVATFEVTAAFMSDFDSGETASYFNSHLSLEVDDVKWKESVVWNPMMVVTRSRHNATPAEGIKYFFHCVLHKPASMKRGTFEDAVRSFWDSLEDERLDLCEILPVRNISRIRTYLSSKLTGHNEGCVDIDSFHKY
ncbi:MAG: hypothetical protein COB36_10015 [Alphaproteobacteria bacterium]|nr:MAG: hypothetical protein COB36_10015 [Alphaproteobacteria bacterium]